MTGLVTNLERARMRGWRHDGVTEREIARRTGRPLTTVQRHVGDLPASSDLVDQPGRLSAQARAALARTINGGMPATRAAFRFGVSAAHGRTIAAQHRVVA